MNFLKALGPMIRLIWWIVEETAWAQKMAKVVPFMNPISDQDAMQELARDLARAEEQRKKQAAKDNAEVLTLKGAMEAVHKHIGVGKELLALIKGLGSILAGDVNNNAISRIENQIHESMLEVCLRKDRPRRHKVKKGWFRPGARA